MVRLQTSANFVTQIDSLHRFCLILHDLGAYWAPRRGNPWKSSTGPGENIVCHLSLSGEYLDILAISCDSFDEATNQLIGRTQGRKSHVENLHKIRHWCQQYKVAFKINSVINTFNLDEDMTENITELDPVRWKVRVERERRRVCVRARLGAHLCFLCSGVPVFVDRW